LIVIAHPAMARDPSATARSVVFMPVSTPGIGSAGHLFRLDGGVALPLHALYDDELPTAAQVIDELAARVRARASQPASMPG
jgi:formylmethanofuran dehydrogenase subunit B